MISKIKEAMVGRRVFIPFAGEYGEVYHVFRQRALTHNGKYQPALVIFACNIIGKHYSRGLTWKEIVPIETAI